MSIENKPVDYPVITKIATGIEGFDLISLGGIPQGRTTLVAGSSGSSKTIMGLQFLVRGINDYQENAVFVTFEETPNEIKRNVKSFNWDLQAFEELEQWAFVDVSPDPGSQNEVIGEFDLGALMARIEHAVEKVQAKRVVIDSIGALFSQFEDTSIVRREMFRIASGLKLLGVTTIITAERLEEYGEVARFKVEEFVADNVIILRHVMEDARRRRTVEILKFRGARHQNGEYPFTISDHGIEVMPLSAMKLEMVSSDLRIPTGNAELDKMCDGGFYRDSIVLASGATGTGKTLLVTTFLNSGCEQNEKTLVFAFEESQSQLLRNAIGWGMDFRQWEEKGLLKISCAYPETSGLPEHLLRMKEEIKRFEPTRIAIDSLSALERVSKGKAFREFVIGITSFIKENQIAGLFTAVTPSLMGGVSVTEQHISTITDSIILLRYVELMGEMRRGITVLKMRGSQHEKTIREYDIDHKGMHIGKAYRNVGGILQGSPQQLISNEAEKLGGMFDD
jgi:circadian clock protein KaiC